MSSVLGVSVGASAVRLVRPGSSDLNQVLSQSVDSRRPEELAAESIGVVLTGDANPGRVHHAGVAYRDAEQAGAVHAAMARQQLRSYRLVPEVRATLHALEDSGVLGSAEVPLIYDLGSSGLTISVVDRASGDVLETLRTDTVGGDLFDRLVRDNQVSAGRLRSPRTEAESRALDAQCRAAKEQLSKGGAVCVPGDSGLLLLSRSVFDSLVTVAVESSARLAREVIARSPRVPDLVVLVGGGAHIPLVRSVMESWIALPTVVPEDPETVSARGAGMLVHSESSDEVRPPTKGSGTSESEPDWAALIEDTGSASEARARKRKIGTVAASIAVLGILGIGVAVGGALTPGATAGEAVPAPPTSTSPSTTSVAPPPPPPAPPKVSDAAPAPTRTPQRVQIPEPEPPPPPPPGPVFPGLPPLQLPPIQLPELPRFPR